MGFKLIISPLAELDIAKAYTYYAKISFDVLAHESSLLGFRSGLFHPVLGLDHLLAMVSVGVISHQMGGRAIWAVPTTFVGVMALVGILGMINIGLFLSQE